MRCLLISCGLLFFVHLVQAQDFEIKANLKPLQFQTFVYDSLNFDPGTPGTDKIWDYSHLRISESFGPRAISGAKGTPFEDIFPEANRVILRAEGEKYLYDKLTKDSLIQLGSAYLWDLETTKQRIVRNYFPIKVGNIIYNSDTLIHIINDHEQYDSTIQYIESRAEIDAEGMLTLPNTKPEKALRMKSRILQRGEFYQKGTLRGFIKSDGTRYSWFIKDMVHPEYFFYEVDTNRSYRDNKEYIGGKLNMVVGGNVPLPNSTHIINTEAFKISVSTNHMLDFELNEVGEVELALISSDGKTILEKVYPSSQFRQGKNRLDLNKLAVANGFYVIILNGESQSQAFKWRKQ